MAQPRYRVQFMNPGTWEPIIYFEEMIKVDWSRKSNDVGEAKITIPDDYPVSMFPRDTRILIWREKDYATTLAGNTIWLIRSIERDLEEKVVQFQAKDANILLENRVVGYTGQTIYADKTNEEWDREFGGGVNPPVSDDMIKEYVYENMSTGAIDVNRRLPTSLFNVEADQTLGAIVQKTASFQNLLATIQDVAKQSEDAGIKVFFDMIPDVNTGAFLFRTWVNFRGRDRTADTENPLTFSQELENLSKVTLTTDYMPEYNFLYFLGIGTGSDKLYREYENSASIRNDPFGRREFVYEDSEIDNEDGFMDDQSRGLLRGAAATITMRGEAVDTPLAQYGVDYDFGDLVSARVESLEFDCFVDAVSATYEDGEEKINIKLESVVPVLI